MSDRLREIDTSVIDDLLKIKQEQDRIKGFMAKAEEMKDRTDQTVYARVRKDYDRRLATLEEQAAPVKIEVRKKYNEFLELHRSLTQTLEEARTLKEELEFRHAVGELGDDESAKRCREAEELLKRRMTEIEKADQLKGRFLEAFPSIEDVGAEPAPEESPAELRTVPIPASGQTESTDQPAPVQSPEPQSQVPEAEPTLLVPPARLIVEGTGKEYHLGTSITIGRGSENHIRLAEPRVSRKHASVILSEDGYSITDENSSSGTLVNGKKISNGCLLADGDQVTVGVVNMVFRSP